MGWSPGFIENDDATADNLLSSRRITHKRCLGVKGVVADKDVLPILGRIRRALRGVDVNVGGAIKDTEIGEV